jgi:hypothetical protein
MAILLFLVAFSAPATPESSAVIAEIHYPVSWIFWQ